MKIVKSIAELREARQALMGTVGFVPTMGYLHGGHMSLVQVAVDRCDAVVASIFVNPTQFGEDDDLDTYPRDIDRDRAMLEKAGVDVVFAPDPDAMYPDRFQTYVTVEEVTQGKEGGQRPGHFRGVATIVTKLFNLVQPDYAFFGQKDAQQVVVIRQMVRDLNIPVNIMVVPIVRESDGLALSSRNVYLSDDERRAAGALSRALRAVSSAYAQGERSPDTLRQIAMDVINGESLATLDYVSLADARTLEEITASTDNPLLLSLAAQVGKPRLLDNMLLPEELNTLAGATRTLGAHSM